MEPAGPSVGRSIAIAGPIMTKVTRPKGEVRLYEELVELMGNGARAYFWKVID